MSNYTPNEANGFLLEGTTCECDGAPDGPGKCENHDEQAETAFWLAHLRIAGPTNVGVLGDWSDAYEPNDPKNPDYIERLIEQVDA